MNLIFPDLAFFKFQLKKKHVSYKPYFISTFLNLLILGGAAAPVGASKHFDPTQRGVNAVVECPGNTNQDLERNFVIEFWDDLLGL